MESNSAKPKRKVSQNKNIPRAATLPAGAVAPAVLSSHKGGGFLGKLRKCLRLGSKGKYDFNHSALTAGLPSDADRRAESHMVSVENGTDRPCEKASPLRVTRRQTQDKEDVILIRKDKRTSGVLQGVSRSEEALNKICSDVFVVKLAEGSPKVESVCVSAAAKTCDADQQKGSITDEVFDEHDPDYETLDAVQQKVREQVEQDVSSPLPGEKIDTKEKVTRQGMHTKDKTNSDVSGRDSGLGSPFMDSPVISSHSHSPLLSEASEYLREGIQTSTFSSHFAEPQSGIGIRHVLAKYSGPQLDSSKSASELEDEDIYANSKVIIRKKSSKRSQISVPSDRHSFGGLTSDQAAVGGQPETPTSAATSVEDPTLDPLVPPPLPERNYSEEDFASLAVFQSSSCPNVTRASTKDETVSDSGQMTFWSVAHVNEAKMEKDARHRTTGFKTSWPETGGIEGSVSSRCCEAQPCVSNECEKLNILPVNTSCVDLDSPSMQNHTSSMHHHKPTNDSPVLSSQTETKTFAPAETGEVVPGDIMIVSASDSMCEITADAQISADLFKDNHINNLHEESAMHTGLTKQTGSVDHVAAQKRDGASASKATAEAFFELENHSDFPEGALEWLETKVNMEGVTAPKKSSCAKDESNSPAVAHQPESAGEHQAGTSLSNSSPSLGTEACTMQQSLSDTAESVDTCEMEGRKPPVGPLVPVLLHESPHPLDCGALEPPPLPLRSVPGRTESCSRSTRLVIVSRKQARDTPHLDKRDSKRHSSGDTASSSHQDFLESMKQLKDCGWYWGPLSYEEAESKLGDKPDGSFLVRDSSNENYILSLSFKSMGHVHHTRIEHHKGLFSFWSQPDSHGKAKICQFIEQTIENSKNGRFLYFLRPAGPGSPPLPIQLLYPVSRFCRVPSLQHMCRFLVLRWVRRDHVDHLPLPQKVKAYLLEKQYYVETLEED